jgi:protein required for attachment to host cells
MCVAAIQLIRRTWPVVLAAALLLGVPAAVASQSRPNPPDTIRLRFNWPVGKVATVETTRFRERVTEKTDTFAGGARYRMQVQQHPDGLLIAYDSFAVTTTAATPLGALALQAVADRAADLVPSYVVSREGEFLRVHDVAGIRERMNTLLGSMLQAEDSTGQARATLQSVLSEQVLNSIAAQEWNALVGMWIEADLELGEKYELEEEAPIPLIPGSTVTMVAEFSIERRVPCQETGTMTDCVEIHLRSKPDPEEVKLIIRRFMDRIATMPQMASFGFESLDLENELVLIIEPATLLPHRARLSKRVKGVVVAEGKKNDVSQHDVRTFRFKYR